MPDIRLVTYGKGANRQVGIWTQGGIVPSPYADMLDVIDNGQAAIDALHAIIDDAQDAITADDVRILAPLIPRKILACGLNYESHFLENPNAVLPNEPFFFSKLPSAVIGPGDPIVLPHSGLEVDYEVELAVIVGKRGYRVHADEALSIVFGYTLMNDVSARAVQFRDQQITLGKNLDTFAPLGPCIVLPEAIHDPQDLTIRSVVNGALRQEAHTSEQLCSVADAIAWVSAFVTLEPGDVIATGTPAGCGTFMRPPRWLQPGDAVTLSCDVIGEMSNPVVGGPWYDRPWEEARAVHSSQRALAPIGEAGA